MQGFLERRLSATAVAQAKHHIDSCSSCRRLMAALASAEDSSPDVSSSPSLQAILPTLPGPTSALSGTVARADQPLARGDTVGRYLVIQRLGAGSMGAVYRARDPQLNREIALKVLHGLLQSQSPELAARLLGEAEAMARLSHPNVVAVYDSGTADGRVFIAMELVSGTTLARWLTEPRRWQSALGIGLQTGKGLAAAHAAGLVHRDFKPDNVLVTADGRACVSDFGLARSVAEPPSPTSSSVPIAPISGETGMLIGTPAYMAPEQLRGQAADQRTDQFGFCVALYEAFYRSRPFRAANLAALLDAMPAGPTPPGKTKVPARIFRVLARGLSVRPEDRYPSIAALLGDLESTARAAARRVWLGVAASMVLLTIAIGVGVALRPAAPAAAGSSFQPEMKPFVPSYDEGLDSASISPDGRFVAFTSDRDKAHHLRLYLQPLGDGLAKELSPAGFEASLWTPRWAADSESVFVVDDGGTGWRVFADTRPMVKVAEPVISINECGGRLLLQHYAAEGCPVCEALTLRSSDGTEREIYRTSPQGVLADVRCDRQGKRAVFAIDHGAAEREGDVWVLPLDGGPILQVTHDPFSQNVGPVFTPGGDSCGRSRSGTSPPSSNSPSGRATSSPSTSAPTARPCSWRATNPPRPCSSITSMDGPRSA